MPVKDSNKKSGKRSYVNICFRLRGSKKAYRFLNQLAGANRYLWNAALAKAKQDYKETGKSKTSQFDLYKWYKTHKDTEADWLKEYPQVLTRTGLKDLSVVYSRFFKKTYNFSPSKKKGKEKNLRGLPKFKKKGKAKKTFAVDVSGGSRFTVNGYFRLKRGLHMKMIAHHRTRRYTNPVPKSARIFEEYGNWYITVCYEVDAVERQADRNGIGVDRNVGQVADSTGQIHYLTDTTRREKRIKQLQRRQAKRTVGSCKYRKTKHTIARHQSKIANIRRNDLRHIALDYYHNFFTCFSGRPENQRHDDKCKGNGREPRQECEGEVRNEPIHPEDGLGAVGILSCRTRSSTQDTSRLYVPNL